jgi:F-type H+-transporting ATPase subunit gamma
VSDTLEGLRRKLEGAAKLESVVRAMKALAAASIGQYEAALRALGDYQRSVEIGLHTCLPVATTPVRSASPGTPAPIGAIVFGSDQGLVGRFNEVIAEFALGKLTAIPGPKRIWGVGDRVCEHLAAAGLALAGRHALPGSADAISALVEQLQFECEASHSKGECAEVLVFNNRPQSMALYRPVSLRLLPLDAGAAERQVRPGRPSGGFREILGAGDATRSALVREYLFICLYKACAESLASENGSRLVAMQSAQKNIEALAAVTSHCYYRLRQSSIDEDLFDVMTGVAPAFNSLLTPAARGAQP